MKKSHPISENNTHPLTPSHQGRGNTAKSSTLLKLQRAMPPAVILAAGQGERMHAYSPGKQKPLVRFLGLSLLERAIMTAYEAGVREIYVVTGFQKEKVETHVLQIQRQRGIAVHLVDNPDWEKGNGTSVLACAGVLNKPFFLLMCDHVFEPEILSFLYEDFIRDPRTQLVVDPRLGEIFDKDDATKVKRTGKELLQIGKKITDYDAVDTGIFLCHPELFKALLQARSEGKYGISDAIQKLATQRKMGTVDIGHLQWMDVDTAACFTPAKKMLSRDFFSKNSKGWVSHFLTRRLAWWLADLFAMLSIPPKMGTLLGLSSFFAAALLFSRGAGSDVMLAGLLCPLALVFEDVEEAVDRMMLVKKRTGDFFSVLPGNYADFLVTLGITFGFWQQRMEAWVWFGGMLSLTGFVLLGYFGQKKDKEGDLSRQPARSFGRSGMGTFFYPGRDLRYFVILIGAFLGIPFFSMVGMGLFSHAAIVSQMLWFLLSRKRTI